MLVVAFLPDLPLRDLSGIQARQADDAAAMAAESAAEAAIAPGGSAPATATQSMSDARRSARPD